MPLSELELFCPSQLFADIKMFWGAVYAGLVLGLYLSLRYIVEAASLWSRHRAARRNLGCQDPPHYAHCYPFGIDLILKRKKAVDEGRYNPLFVEHFNKYGPTWSENQLGLFTINSMEPENRHAVLSSQTQDYGPPPFRREAMLPFLGQGIFSEHGQRWKHSRDLITPIFGRTERLTDLDMFRAHVERFMTKIPSNGETVDLQVLFNKLVWFRIRVRK